MSTTTTTVFNFLLKNSKLVTIPLTFNSEQSLVEQFQTALKDAGDLVLPLTYIDATGQPRRIHAVTEISELVAGGVTPLFFNATSVLTRIDGEDVEELDDQDTPEDEVEVVAEVTCLPGKRGHHHRIGKHHHRSRSHSKRHGHCHKRHGKRGPGQGEKPGKSRDRSSSTSSSSSSSSSSRSPSKGRKNHEGRPSKARRSRSSSTSSSSSSSSSSRSRSRGAKHHHGRRGPFGPFGPHKHHGHHGHKGHGKHAHGPRHCLFGGRGPRFPAGPEDFCRFGGRGPRGFEGQNDSAPFWEHMMRGRGGRARGARGGFDRRGRPFEEEFSRMSMGLHRRREMPDFCPIRGPMMRGGFHEPRGAHHEGFPAKPEPELSRRAHWRHSFIF